MKSLTLFNPPNATRRIEHALVADARLAQFLVQVQAIAVRVFLQHGDQPAGVGDHPDLGVIR